MNGIVLLFRYAAQISAIAVSAMSMLLVLSSNAGRAEPARKLLLKQIAIFTIIAIFSLTAYAVLL